MQIRYPEYLKGHIIYDKAIVCSHPGYAASGYLHQIGKALKRMASRIMRCQPLVRGEIAENTIRGKCATLVFQQFGQSADMIVVSMGEEPGFHRGSRTRQLFQQGQQRIGVRPAAAIHDDQPPGGGTQNVGHHLTGGLGRQLI